MAASSERRPPRKRDRSGGRPSKIALGRILASRYELVGELGEGGTGTTYVARDHLYDRDVAIKIVRDPSPELRAALRTELRSLAGLEHPGLVRVRDLGTENVAGEEPIDYLVTELVAGTSLERHAPGRRLDELLEPLCDALEGLHYLHRLGLLHGDVKPENVVVGAATRGRDRRRGTWHPIDRAAGVLLDLGCARPLGVAVSEVSGTPGFIAPELLGGAAPDARADLFAVGKTIGRLVELTGAPLSRSMRSLVAALVAIDPAERPTDVAEVLQALGRHGDLLLPPGGKASSAIGRERETSVVIDAIDALVAKRAGPRVVWIGGPAGIGKSRLLAELKWQAQLRARVVEGDGQCPDAIARWVSMALGSVVRDRMDALLDARAKLAADARRTVLVMDDVERLDERDARRLASCLRMVTPDDAALWLLASRDAPPSGIAASVGATIVLGPLDHVAVGHWVGTSLSGRRVRELVRATGGVPVRLERAIAALGSRPESEVIAASERDAGAGNAADLASATTVDERRALARVAILDELGVDEGAPGADPAVLPRLVERGWVLRHEGTYRLHGLSFEGVVGAALQDDADTLVAWVMQMRNDRVASVERRSACDAMVVRLLAGAGRFDDALARTVTAKAERRHAPGAWLRVVPMLQGDLGRGGLEAAEIELGAGRARDALARVARIVRRAADPETRDRARLLGASARLRLGRASRVLSALDRVRPDGMDRGARATANDLRARALLALGRYGEAEAEARRGLAWTDEPGVVAALRESVGVAASYLGEHVRARDELSAAAHAWTSVGDPRAVVRVRSYEAIAAFREGDVERAIARHREAIATAEAAGLDDQLASVLLNVGTALQQRGDWGEAMSVYERGRRLARALGKTSTEALLAFNLANVFAAIGVVERAERTLDEMAPLGSTSGGESDVATQLPALAAAVLALRGEIASVRGEMERARALVRESRDQFEKLGARREVLERELDDWALTLRAANGAGAHVRTALDDVAREAQRSGATDVAARAEMLAGRNERLCGEAGAAIARLERAHEEAKRVASPGLLGEVESELAATWELAGDAEVAAKHRARARERWSRVSLGLPVEMRDAFWRQPLRAELRTRPRVGRARDADETRSAGKTPSLERVLEVNRRLASSLVASEVIAHALDAAIELTGAERGFVLLKKERAADAPDASSLEVGIARNLDRERIGRSHLKFSHGIAAAVVLRGEPIVTTDAAADDRFRGHASVHAMKLTSVACVPIRAPDGVLGAIYLDNRFERGRFGPGDVETLQAFADQAAIALRNARLHAALETRTRELEVEKARVEELARAQAKEIEQLHEQRRTTDEPSRTRHEYRELVGRSMPMRRLLATLDRVVDSPLPVLVTGESGTGKELVARATHAYGPRRDLPFVGINCAALPEALLESELFGYVRGAFTGADRDRPGLFVAARGGTLFLDEIGETSLAMQAKLLRVLQEREVRPLGATRSTRVDFRLVAATNRRLRDEIAHGRFREDLYYRIAVVEIVVPALRDRLEDLPALARALLDRLAREAGRAPPTLTTDAMRLLARQSWPGNVRELENVLARALTMTEARELSHLDLDLAPNTPPASAPSTRSAHERDEAARILAALRDTSFRVSEVARRLGIPRNTLYRRMRRYGITLRD